MSEQPSDKTKRGIFTQWALDVTLPENLCFVPISGDDVITGMMVVSDRCPGELVALYHADSQEAVEAWEAEHPDWHEKYKRMD